MLSGSSARFLHSVSLSGVALRHLRVRLSVGLALLLLFSAPSTLANNDVHLVVAESARYYQQVADDIVVHLRNFYPDKKIHLHSKATPATFTPAEDSLLICIGTTASIQGMKNFPYHKQLNLFITSNAWRQLTADLPTTFKANLFIDQPPERLFVLAHALTPNAKRFATVLGPASLGYQRQLEHVAAKVGTELMFETVTPESNPLTILGPLMDRAEVFIALPDNAAITRNLAKWALYLAFRHNIPVVGFAEAYTQAGAAASLYTSTSDIARQGTEWLDDYFGDNNPDHWRSFSPSYFTVNVNASVLRTLGLETKTPEVLEDRVLHLLSRPTP